MLGSVHKRIAVALLVGCLSGFPCWAIHGKPVANDFYWTLQAAHDLLTGHNPYDGGFQVAPYPLPAAIIGLPFAFLEARLAGALFFGASSALLAFGLSRDGYSRLLVFLAFPYWMALLDVQWSPLIMAGALIPWLLPATLAKPQIGAPVLLTRCNRHGLLACGLVLLASFLILPNWPVRWLAKAGSWPHFVPMFALPLGPLLLLALWRLRDPDVGFLLLTALTPQHWFYDSFILWLIPKDRREILATAALSWGAGIWRFYVTAHSWNEVGSAAISWIYLPMLGVVLLRGYTFGGSRTRTVAYSFSRNPPVVTEQIKSW